MSSSRNLSPLDVECFACDSWLHQNCLCDILQHESSLLTVGMWYSVAVTFVAQILVCYIQNAFPPFFGPVYSQLLCACSYSAEKVESLPTNMVCWHDHDPTLWVGNSCFVTPIRQKLPFLVSQARPDAAKTDLPP